MSRSSHRTSSCSDDTCAVCSEIFNIYAIGRCDHLICFKCSVRMRVLCDQTYCAICRSNLPKVIFVKKPHKFSNIDTSNFIHQKHFNLFFEDEQVKNQFQQLLLHSCSMCSQTRHFNDFYSYKAHLEKVHHRYFCKLCVKHLKIFTSERKIYNQKTLAEHMHVGDKDDKSHKGHPLCEFCNTRYLDNDELAKHLRKDHYFCHFCDADGFTHQYYNDYSILKAHFQHEHFLCEEAECSTALFTNAFRTEIDLKAHRSSMHARLLKKSELRQARTIDIDVHLAPRPSTSSSYFRNSNRGNTAPNSGDIAARHPRREARQNSHKQDTRYDRNRTDVRLQDLTEEQKENQQFENVTEVINQRHAEPAIDNFNSQALTTKHVDPTVERKKQHSNKRENFQDKSNEVSTRHNFEKELHSIKEENTNTNTLLMKQNSPAKSLPSDPKFIRKPRYSEEYPSLQNSCPPPKSDLQKQQSQTIEVNDNQPKNEEVQQAAQISNNSSNLFSIGNSGWVSSSKRPDTSSITDFPSLSSIGNMLTCDQKSSATPATVLDVPRPSKQTAITSTKTSTKHNNTLKSENKKINKNTTDLMSQPQTNFNNFEDLNVNVKDSRSISLMQKSHSSVCPKNEKNIKTISNKPEENAFVKKSKPINISAKEFPELTPKKHLKEPPDSGLQALDRDSEKGKTHSEQKQKSSLDFKIIAAGNKKNLSVISDSCPNVNVKCSEQKINKKDKTSKDKNIKNPKMEKKSLFETTSSNDDFNYNIKITKTNIDIENKITAHGESSNKINEKNDEFYKDKKNQQFDDSNSVKEITQNKPENTNKPKKNNIIYETQNENNSSEDKVTSVTLSNFQLDLLDFPSITSTISYPTPGLSKPPGFESIANTTEEKPPPPGFSNKVDFKRSDQQPAYNFSTTSLLSEKSPASNSTVPLVNNNNHYVNPPNYELRSKALYKKVLDILGDNKEKLTDFQTNSMRFRAGEMTGSLYYTSCSQLLGENHFVDVFPELLVLLPNIQRQQELLSEHNDMNHNHLIKIAVCSNCKQVLDAGDLTPHKLSHGITDDFPSLSKNQNRKLKKHL